MRRSTDHLDPSRADAAALLPRPIAIHRSTDRATPTWLPAGRSCRGIRDVLAGLRVFAGLAALVLLTRRRSA